MNPISSTRATVGGLPTRAPRGAGTAFALVVVLLSLCHVNAIKGPILGGITPTPAPGAPMAMGPITVPPKRGYQLNYIRFGSNPEVVNRWKAFLGGMPLAERMKAIRFTSELDSTEIEKLSKYLETNQETGTEPLAEFMGSVIDKPMSSFIPSTLVDQFLTEHGGEVTPPVDPSTLPPTTVEPMHVGTVIPPRPYAIPTPPEPKWQVPYALPPKPTSRPGYEAANPPTTVGAASPAET